MARHTVIRPSRIPNTRARTSSCTARWRAVRPATSMSVSAIPHATSSAGATTAGANTPNSRNRRPQATPDASSTGASRCRPMSPNATIPPRIPPAPMAADRIAAPDSPVPNCSIAISTNSTSQAPISSMRDDRIATISRASGCSARARNPPRIAGPRTSGWSSSARVQRRVVRLVREVRRPGVGMRAEPQHEDGRGHGDQREEGEHGARPRHGQDRRRRQGPEQQAARLRDARDGVGRGQLGRIVGEAREERVVRGSHEGQRHRRRDRREVDHRHRPREQHPGGDQRGPGREQRVGSQEDVLPPEPVAERAPERRDDGRRQQLRERHEAHGRRSRSPRTRTAGSPPTTRTRRC